MISKIVVENFRHYRERKEFIFNNSPFVLLTASNGQGKTTLVDAIEWCLTGNIRRLQRSFLARSTNQPERGINTRGILKNKNSLDAEKVVVELTITDSDGEHTICRSRTLDALIGTHLNEDDMIFEVDNNDSSQSTWFMKFKLSDFYNTHVCDIQKAFALQSEKRENNEDLLKDYISNYDEAEQVSISLSQINKKINEVLNKDKDELSDITRRVDELKKQQNQYLNEESKLDYPQERYYEDEILDFADVETERVSKQKSIIEQYVYSRAASYQKDILESKKLKATLMKMDQLTAIVSVKYDAICAAVENGINSENSELQKTLEKVEWYSQTKINNENVFEIASKIAELESLDLGTFKNLSAKVESTKSFISKTEADIKMLSEGNEILNVFTDLIKSKSLWIDYKEHSCDDKLKCPVCGSLLFGEMNSDDLMVEAENYIDRCNKDISKKSKEITEYNNQLELLYKTATNEVVKIRDKQIEKHGAKLKMLRNLQAQTQDYFDCVDSLRKLHDFSQIDIVFYDVECIRKTKTIFENRLAELAEAPDKLREINPLLKIIGYDDDNKSDEEYWKDFIVRSNGIHSTNVSIDQLKRKIIFLYRCLSDVKFKELGKKIEEESEKAKNKEKEIETTKKLFGQISERRNEIIKTVNELKEKEYNAVWPNLEQIYKKLALYPGVEKMQVKREDSKDKWLSLQDENGKQIVNVLSNGQLSVLVLSFFFARIITTGEREELKVYFLDDLTACLDDINMLAFLELMKHQVKAGTSIDQMVFSTCDKRISSLIRYKFEKANIDICELGEDAF